MFVQRCKRKGHGHCGLITFVHEQFRCKYKYIAKYNEADTAWGYMCFEISHCKPNSNKYIVSNIFETLKEKFADYALFTDEFSCFLKDVDFIRGDFNIHLLLMTWNQYSS